MKFLICRLSSLGDVLLTTPVLRLLRKKFPEARIDFLVKKEFADVLRSNPHITNIIEFSESSLTQLVRFRSELRNEYYDVVIDLHNSLRTRLLRFHLAAQLMVVKKNIFKRWMLVNCKKNYYTSNISVPEKYIRTLFPLGIVNDGEGLELYIDDSTRDSMQGKQQQWNIDKNRPTVIFSPTAKHKTKMWLPEYFIALGKKIAEKNNTIIYIVGAPNEATYCDRIAQGINSSYANTAFNTAGRFSLLETASLMENCSAVVTNDSAMQHIASALHKNVVAIFGSTVEEFGFAPYRTNFRIVQNEMLQCRPCSHIGKSECPQQHFSCIKDISVERVYQSYCEIIDEGNNK